MSKATTTSNEKQKQQHHQPFYYHIDDISNTLKERLVISVTLKKILQESNKALQQYQEKNSSNDIDLGNESSLQNKLNDIVNNSLSPQFDVTCNIKWQEKIFSPMEDNNFSDVEEVQNKSTDSNKNFSSACKSLCHINWQ